MDYFRYRDRVLQCEDVLQRARLLVRKDPAHGDCWANIITWAMSVLSGSNSGMQLSFRASG